MSAHIPTTAEVRDAYVAGTAPQQDLHGEVILSGRIREGELVRFNLWKAQIERVAAVQALRDAAHRIETHAARTDNRFTEHVVAEAGGADMLREYAEMYLELTGETVTPPAPSEV